MTAHLVRSLNNGGIAVIPTDTIYGLVASARDRKAVARLYRLRRKAPRKPFIILIDNVARLGDFGVRTTSAQNAFLNNVWPGKVSVILPVKGKRFEYLHRGTNSLAFRLPNSKRLQRLLVKTGPLAAPSANPEGKKPAQTIAEAQRYFGDSAALYVSAGRRYAGRPSTLVSLTHKKPRLLRKGAAKVNL